jgi:hypothetical protein
MGSRAFLGHGIYVNTHRLEEILCLHLPCGRNEVIVDAFTVKPKGRIESSIGFVARSFVKHSEAPHRLDECDLVLCVRLYVTLVVYVGG